MTVQAYVIARARLAEARRTFARLADAVAELGRVLTEMREPGGERTVLVHEMTNGSPGPTSSHPWPSVREVNRVWSEVFRAMAAVRQTWDAIPPGDRAGLQPPDLAPGPPAGPRPLPRPGDGRHRVATGHPQQ